MQTHVVSHLFTRTQLVKLIYCSFVICNCHSFRSSRNLPIRSTKIPMTKSEESIKDAKAYHSFISAAVDVSSIDVLSQQIPSTHEKEQIQIHRVTFLQSTRDLDTNSRRSYLHSLSIGVIPDEDKDQTRYFTLPTNTLEIPAKVKVRCVSPSGTKVALLIEEAELGSTNKRDVLEIWTNRNQDGSSQGNTSTQSLVHRIVLPSQKMHAKISVDTTINGPMPFSWNPEETSIAYCAEVITPKTASFFSRDIEINTIVGGQNSVGIGKNEEWGEALVGINPIIDIFIVNIRTGKVGVLSNGPNQNKSKENNNSVQGYTLAQVIFSPDGKHLVYVGFDAGGGGYMPRRLGLIHCINRRSWIFCSKVDQLIQTLSKPNNIEPASHDLDQEFNCISEDSWVALSPRFSFNGPNPILAYLACPNMDTHSGNMALHIAEWSWDNIQNIKSRILVDQVAVPREGTKCLGMGFPGIFSNQLPIQCFSPDGNYVYINTQWGSATKIIRVSTIDGSISLIRNDPEAGSENLLFMTGNGDAIISLSEPNMPAKFMFVPSKLLSSDQIINSHPIPIVQVAPIASTNFSPVDEVPNGAYTYHVVSVNHPEADETSAPLQGILLLPTIEATNSDKIPLIVVPHGGPHSCTTTSYMPMYSFLCEQGRYAILHVNYRGSTGFGKAALESLAGKIGDQDVGDVKLLTEAALERYAHIIDSNRLGICGGSHGGFLGAHLIGQYPKMFKAACLRNPVINIPSMVSATDIPDWTFIESLGLGSYDWSSCRPPTKEDLMTMYERSPSKYYEKVSTPTLIALGLADKRVPPSQGLEYYYTLRSNGVKMKLLCYDEDNHAISKPISEADHWVNIKHWFDEYL